MAQPGEASVSHFHITAWVDVKSRRLAMTKSGRSERLTLGVLSRTLTSAPAPSAVEISESVVGREKDAQFLPLWLSDLKRALKDLNSAKDKR